MYLVSCVGNDSFVATLEKTTFFLHFFSTISSTCISHGYCLIVVLFEAQIKALLCTALEELLAII